MPILAAWSPPCSTKPCGPRFRQQDRPVRSLAITFVGQAAPGVPIQFEVEVLREGKAVSQVLGRAMQDGEVVTLVRGQLRQPRVLPR